MRPIELRLRGFRSYRGETVFDWRGRGLVGIVGPIGAGKSSILDATAFALYGKTPAVERDTKSLIHQLCDECHVELRFEVDGQVWRAVRSLRRKGASGHQLERLASDDADAQVDERVTGDDLMKARVEQLLGMDFKAFCRSVLLAQNRFSDFLTSTPGERDRVLKGVFGYERLDEAQRVAKMRLQGIELELVSMERERRTIDDARTQLEGARADAGAAQRRLQELEATAPEAERLTKEREAAAADERDARAQLASLDELVATLPTEAEVRDTAARGAGAERLVAEALAAAETAEAAMAAAAAQHADVVARLGDRERFRSFEALLDTFDRQRDEARRSEEALAGARGGLEAADERARTLAEEAASAAAALTESEIARAEAAVVVAEARGALTDARHAEMARELRSTLVAGEACPVCEQPVHAVPRTKGAATVAAAARAVTKAERLETKAETERTKRAADEAAARTAAVGGADAVTSATGAVTTAEQASAKAEAAAAATGSQLVEWLGDEGDPHDSFRARESELAAAEEVRDAAKAAIDAARAAAASAKDAATEAGRALARIGGKLSGAWGKLGEDREIEPDAASVEVAFLELGEEVVGRHEAAATAATESSRRAGEATQGLASLMREIGLEPGEDLAAARTAAGVTHGRAAQVVRELEERIERAGALEADVLAAEGRRDIAHRLAEDLKPSRFLAFLLEEERAQLADLGSEHFEQLTDGTYRFTQDDRFDILDINAAGTVRKADSLSGGETFLASLALALGLAEMVARSGGRLDAFFLDEGFGSLDPEHLDRAMDGIGRLVAEDARRLVVVVSHVAEMREAVEDLVVLDKDTLTGDTRVLSGASPA